ncbi:MAG: hypothetical protein R3F65_33235 [bacterium]
MPSNTHPSFTAPAEGFPESLPAGSRPFYLGLIAHLPANQSPVVLRLNEDEHDELLLYPGSTRLLGRNANRPIRRWQTRCLGLADATVSIEFTEEPQPDTLVWHASGAQGPAGPAGAQGEPGEPAGALVRVRAIVGAGGLVVPSAGTVDLVAGTATFNVGGGYNGADGVFTSPGVDLGVYHVHAMACLTTDQVSLALHVSSDGGNNWSPVAATGAGTHIALTDYVALAAGSMAKFVLSNAGGVDATCEGVAGSTARSYLLISRIA